MPLTIMNPNSAAAAPRPASESDAALAALGRPGFS